MRWKSRGSMTGLVARAVLSGRSGGSATLDKSNYLNAAFSCWCHAIKANSIR